MKKNVKEQSLIKMVLGMLLLTVILTWIIPSGSFSTGAEFVAGKLERIGLLHISYGLVYAIQNFSIQIVYLIFIGIFYGVISHLDSYKKLVANIAKKFSNKKIVFAVVVSFIIAVLASILANGYILIVFIPFIIHILRSMGFDKLSSFVATFGAMLVALLGATYGTEGATALITYMGYGGSEVTIETEILIRAGILLVSFILYTFFNINYLKKNVVQKENEENKETDLFALEPVNNKKAKTWPIIAMFAILFVLAILAFTNWNTFNITCFDDFHTWFMDLKIGSFKIFESIIGANLTNMGYDLATSFGNWYLFSYAVVLALLTLIISLASRMKFRDLLTNAYEGIKSLIKPIGLLVLAYMVFVFIYWSPFIPTIINYIGKISSSFNPFVATFQALIGSIFNSDLGYLGYSISYLLGSYTGNEGNVIYLIYTTIYGLVSFITPVSMFLLFGLSYLNIPYKKWLKYIWKFVVAMLVILLIVFALLTYI